MTSMKPETKLEPPEQPSPTPSTKPWTGYVTWVPGTEGRLTTDPNELPDWLSSEERKGLTLDSIPSPESTGPAPKDS